MGLSVSISTISIWSLNSQFFSISPKKAGGKLAFLKKKIEKKK